jgi:hypothetical protein
MTVPSTVTRFGRPATNTRAARPFRTVFVSWARAETVDTSFADATTRQFDPGAATAEGEASATHVRRTMAPTMRMTSCGAQPPDPVSGYQGTLD